MTQIGGPRVVVVSSRLDIGGTERHLARVLPELRKSGIDISLFVLDRGGSLEPQIARDGVPIAGADRRRPRFVHAVSAGRQLHNYLRQLRPDILHFFLTEPYLVGSIATWRTDLIRIMSRRSLAHYQRRHPMLARLERRLHRRTSVLLGNSAAVVEELVRECGEQHRVGLIHNGISVGLHITPQDRAAMRAQTGLPPDAFVMAIVANLIPYKGHMDLFAALASIKDRLPQPWRLMIIGRDDGVGATLRRYAAERGIADNLIWFDECVDAERLLDAADVAVLTSHEEGFSNSLIEAMARGIPVLATAVGGNLDAVVQGESGILVPVHAPTALATAILELAQDASLRARLGKGGRERVQALFSLDACVRRYVNLYRGIARLDGRPAQAVIDGAVMPRDEQKIGSTGEPAWSMDARSR
jgi:glycosyltransferase involved in cell wall biosynthesis